ncbi:MAG TPA: hypothetical protein VGO43_02700 [Pyrinomonadaceae bacterium]|nr:hypothetical protein [Pyrinomonadaceae bacterium]
MSRESESADLIMKLYELRREEKMRDARRWVITFFPESFDDVMQTVVDEKTSANFRMLTTYWDMAASFVNRGAIDEAMFLDSAGESWVVFAKVQPYLNEYREAIKNPGFMKQLEDLLMRQPNAQEMLDIRRESMKRWMAARAELQAKSA